MLIFLLKSFLLLSLIFLSFHFKSTPTKNGFFLFIFLDKFSSVSFIKSLISALSIFENNF